MTSMSPNKVGFSADHSGSTADRRDSTLALQPGMGLLAQRGRWIGVDYPDRSVADGKDIARCPDFAFRRALNGQPIPNFRVLATQ